jgi:TonB family protein
MTPGIALHEFLPYGAPELHASARRNMSGATVLSSALVTVVFLALLVISPRFAPTPPGPIGTPGKVFVDLARHRIVNPPPLVSRTQTVVTPSRIENGTVVPVDDVHADQNVTIPSQGPGGPLDDIQPGGGGGGTGVVVTPAEPPATLPGPNDYVYSEVLPDPVVRVNPVYPELAKDARVQGTVIVKVMVGTDGRVLDTHIDPAFSIPLLDAAAVEAARRWVFTPALANGRPVVVWVALPFRFTLQN